MVSVNTIYMYSVQLWAVAIILTTNNLSIYTFPKGILQYDIFLIFVFACTALYLTYYFNVSLVQMTVLAINKHEEYLNRCLFLMPVRKNEKGDGKLKDKKGK